jgi:hypothetical protein
MLEEFRELVRAGILRVTPENEVMPVTAANEGTEPEAPASREQDVALLDKQLLEWLERRRAQRSAESRARRPSPAAESGPAAISASIRQKVVERVANKILETWDRADQAADPHQSLREQVVDRLAEDLLRRWQRGFE